MRHEQYDNFDLQVRSMLQDAEVKVPSHVWRAVSSRLEGQAPVAASPWGWTRWAGLSLAVAGALAAALVLSGTFDRHTDAPLVADVPAVVENQPAAVAETSPAEAIMPAETEALPTVAPASRRVADAAPAVAETPGQAAHESVPVAEAAPVADAVSGHEAVAVVPDDAPVVAEAAPAADDVPVVRELSLPDPFALLAAEDARHDRTAKVSLVAQGTFTGNRSEIGVIQHAPFSGSSGEGSPSQIVTEKSASNYGIPVSFGLGVRVQFAPRWSVGTGVEYTVLSRSFIGEYQSFYGAVNNTQQYIGIPVNIFYDIVSSDIFRFYAHGGGAAEYCLSNQFRLERTETPNLLKEATHGLQYSAGLGLGVEFMLSRRLGAYIDPGVRYYFPGEQPKNVRTDNPLLVTFEAGLRFDLGNR